MYFSASFLNPVCSIVKHKEDKLIVATLSNIHIRIKTMAFISVADQPVGCAVGICSNPLKGKSPIYWPLRVVQTDLEGRNKVIYVSQAGKPDKVFLSDIYFQILYVGKTACKFLYV